MHFSMQIALLDVPRIALIKHCHMWYSE